MALEEVQGGNFFKLNKMEVGQTYRCYLLELVDVMVNKRPAKNYNVINAETGEQQQIGTPGNLKYRSQDGSVKTGIYTEITRLDDTKYGSLIGSAFKIAQDKERTIETANLDVVPATPNTNVKAMASEKVKREAEALAAQASGSKR